MNPERRSLAAGEVARRLGVSVTTLRTWHQRYGLGPSDHLAGHHRRYTPADVARLEAMRRLTGLGVPAAEAARIAIGAQPEAGATATRRAGGGHAIPVGRAGPLARGLARAAMRLDGQAMVGLIGAGIREHGVVRTWDLLVCPVLIGIGRRHSTTSRLIEVEHLLSRSVSVALARVAYPADAEPVRVLLACADEEQHTLPMEALAAALAEHGCASRVLGARVPPAALTDAVRRTGPAAVMIWAQVPATAEPAQLRALQDVRPHPALVAAAGPGWTGRDLPPGVERPANLAEALALTLPIAARQG